MEILEIQIYIISRISRNSRISENSRISRILDQTDQTDQTNQTDQFREYISRPQDPYEVEHIWANRYERHTDEFDSEADFQDHRNRTGDLVLLPKSFNASYGDMPYEAKLGHYAKHNILVRSLHPDAYERDPSFLKLKEDRQLLFKPYPAAFTREAVVERQDLYVSIAKIIWDPGTLKVASQQA